MQLRNVCLSFLEFSHLTVLIFLERDSLLFMRIEKKITYFARNVQIQGNLHVVIIFLGHLPQATSLMIIRSTKNNKDDIPPNYIKARDGKSILQCI